MKRLFAISLIIFSIVLASTVQADGSEAQRSITLNYDGTFSIIGQETYTGVQANDAINVW